MTTGSTANDSLHLKTQSDVDDQIQAMRRTFQRTLANWAGDLLILRQRGIRQPTWHTIDQRSDWRQAA